MRRPTRTRRLSIAAILSFLAFVVVAGIGVSSFWVKEQCNFIRLESGRAECVFVSGKPDTSRVFGAYSNSWSLLGCKANILGAYTRLGDSTPFTIQSPLWIPLSLLLLAPAFWLIARPANTPAFQVIAKQP